MSQQPPGEMSPQEAEELKSGEPLKVRSSSAATHEDRFAQERAHEQARKTLELIRASAEKWAATTAAVFTALGFASLLQGRQEIQGLDEEWGIADGAVLLAAFLLSLAAILWAALAAQGTPRRGVATGPELRVFEAEDAKAARSRLKRSRVSTVIAIGLVIAGLGILWYAPQKDSSYVLIDPGGNAMTCVKNETAPPPPGGGSVIKVDDCSTPVP